MSKKDIPNEEVVDLKKDFTEARAKRCEPIVIKILEEMLKEEVLYADQNYIDQKIMTYLEAMFKDIIIDHFVQISETIKRSLGYSLDQASKKLWNKDIGDIAVKDIDQVLKKG